MTTFFGSTNHLPFSPFSFCTNLPPLDWIEFTTFWATAVFSALLLHSLYSFRFARIFFQYLCKKLRAVRYRRKKKSTLESKILTLCCPNDYLRAPRGHSRRHYWLANLQWMSSVWESHDECVSCPLRIVSSFFSNCEKDEKNEDKRMPWGFCVILVRKTFSSSTQMEKVFFYPFHSMFYTEADATKNFLQVPFPNPTQTVKNDDIRILW